MAIHFNGIKLCVFDAYGTLFDVHSAIARQRRQVGDQADAVSDMWRRKQLEYSWLRTLMDRYVDFWRVTADALDYSLRAHGIADVKLRNTLLDAYLTLDCYPEVPAMLQQLKALGLDTAVLSNGSPAMLQAAVRNSGLEPLLDAVLSVDELGVYKPTMEVYQLVLDRFSVGRSQVSFQSSNAWDAAAAATFGFRVVWCNRSAQPAEYLPDRADVEIADLSLLPSIVGPLGAP